MSALADLQHQVSAALLGEPDVLPAVLFAPGPIPLAAALRVHRDTVLGGLVQALRLTFPTVDRLVGEAFFDHAASTFAAECPPAQARLSAYGEGFPEFLERFEPAAALTYLADVARLDLAIDRAIAAPRTMRPIPIDASAMIVLPVSLTVLALAHPADRIRDALEAGDHGALAAIDLQRRPYWIALWRTGSQASVLPLTPPAGAFLDALLAGRAVNNAFAAAATITTADAALLAIQAEVFAAPFALITTNSPEGNRS